MIITRTPYRVSFCGGGTDLPDYYTKYGGCVVSTTIDKYVYITLAKSFDGETTWLKYSTVESVNNLDKIRHPIFRESMKKYDVSGVEINSTGDVPSGTGLGSSSTFTVGLINALRTNCGKKVNKDILAKEACEIELDLLGEPIGKQDQYAAAYGGLNCIEFKKSGKIIVEPIALSEKNREKLNDNLMMFYLGGTRSASKILKKYKNETVESLANKKELTKLALKLRDSLNDQDISSVGEILDKGWKLKKSITTDISNREIDTIYELAIKNGALGGKLLGAGGNGFVMFYVEKKEQNRLRNALKNYKETKFRFDDSGSTVIYNDAN